MNSLYLRCFVSRHPFYFLFIGAVWWGSCLFGPAIPAAADDPEARDSIVVGQPKLFDDRTLTDLLNQTDASLKGLNPFDNSTLTQALGRFQGLTADTTSQGLSVTGPAIPGVSKDVTTNSSSDTTQPTTTQNNIKTTQSEITPSVPPAPDQIPRLSLSNVSFGPSAENLLAEQTSLSYQITNLRLLLQRSLSDRVFINGATFSGKRRQAVLGFQVTVDPAKKYRGKVAEVEICITPSAGKPSDAGKAPSGGQDQKISLVSLIPESKTYNVATITNKVTSLGVGAVVQPVTIGGSISSQHESQYVVRDFDTVALERLPSAKENANSVKFAWQFRPVLGRMAVEPGVRQVYAVLSLPAIANAEDFSGFATVTTRWRDYDNRSGAVYGEVEQSKICSTYPVTVPIQSSVEKALTPKVTKVSWHSADNGRVLVDVVGENFDANTGILVGDTPIGAKDGFTRLHDNRLQFLVDASALMNTPPVIIGSEGSPCPLVNPLVGDQFTLLGISINGVKPAPAEAAKQVIGTTAEVTITLISQGSANGERWKEDFLVNYGGEIFGLPDHPIKVTPNSDGKSAAITFGAPLPLIQECRSVAVVAPFYGASYNVKSDRLLADDFDATKVVLLASNAASTRYGILGNNFQGGITVQVGKTAYTKEPQLRLVSPTLMLLDLTAAETRGLKNILISQGARNDSLLLPISEPAPIVKPIVTVIPDVDAGNATDVKLEGSNLSSVETVQFLNQTLDFTAEDDGKSLTLKASKTLSDLAAASGKKQIYLIVSDGSQVPVVLTVKKL